MFTPRIDTLQTAFCGDTKCPVFVDEVEFLSDEFSQVLQVADIM